MPPSAVTVAAIVPAFLFLAGRNAFAGLIFLIFGFDVKRRSYGSIDAQLEPQTKR